MTIEEVKNYLNQAYYLDKRIDTLQEELTRLESKLQKCTPSYSNIRGSGNQSTFEYTLDRVIMYKELLGREINNLVERKMAIKKSIDNIKDEKAKLILHKRYINFQTFESIAEDLNMSRMHVYRLYQKSLKMLLNVTL